MSVPKAAVALALLLTFAVGGWFGLSFVFGPAPGTGGGRISLSGESATPGDLDLRIKNYLLDNPEVIVQSLRVLQTRQSASQANETKVLIESRSNEIFDDPDSPVGGNLNGDATLVEFFDYNCPYCRRMAPLIVDIERSDTELRIVYKEWPILGPGSKFAARAALASRKQGKYLEFHKAMMQADGRVTEDKVLEIASAVGIDTAQLRKDMEDPAIENAIRRNFELARALRITGTPSFVIGDEILRGATNMDALQGYVTRARQGE